MGAWEYFELKNLRYLFAVTDLREMVQERVPIKTFYSNCVNMGSGFSG